MQKIHFSYLKPEEILAFWYRLLALLQSLIPDDDYLAAIYNRLEEIAGKLSAALGVIRGSKYTIMLAERDGKRDQLFVGFRDYVNAFTYHFDELIVQAARLLQALIEVRGVTLYKYSYAAETSQLNGLFEDLKNPEAQQAIALIKAEFWVEALQQAQQDFEALYQQKVATEAGQDLPQINESKQELIRNLDRLLIYIESQAEIKAEKYQPVVKKIDEVIADMMSSARARKSKRNESKTNPPAE
jgi:hypothetical protein